MTRLHPALLAAALLAVPAQASDPRLVQHRYDPAEVVKVEGHTNVQATIAFDPDEHIENVAIGDSASWQVTPNKRANLLFVKPLAPRAATNMTVVTDRHTYLFDLVATPSAQALYMLRFTYPDEPKPAAPTELAQGPTAVELAAAADPYAVSDPAKLNFAWKRKGAERLMPQEIYDDGEATFITWRADGPIPAILIKDRQGTEGPVNYAVRGETTVVDGVPKEIILRLGDEVATLTNNGTVKAASVDGGATLAINREAK